LPPVIWRQTVAAVIFIEDFNALEDAIDQYFAREADRDLAAAGHPRASCTYDLAGAYPAGGRSARAGCGHSEIWPPADKALPAGGYRDSRCANPGEYAFEQIVWQG
jgi:hypothetical protein